MEKKTAFEHLFRPIQVGSRLYKNRVASTPLGNVSVRPDGSYPAAAFKLFEDRARGGCAEVAASETPVDFRHANRMDLPHIDYTAYETPHAEGLRKYTDMLHSYGAVATIELNHCGEKRFASADRGAPIGPSGHVLEDGREVIEMDEALMSETAEAFAQAAWYMKQVGYDGVIPHMASGWLLQQFLSPLTNHRCDEYGGSLENRMRFPLRVLQAIRKRCGDDFLIIPRFCASENIPGGYGIDEAVEMCKAMDGLVDMIHVVCGIYTDPVISREFSSMYEEHALNANYAAAIKQVVHVPVMLCGGINSPEQAEQLIAEGKTDLVALGRQMLADPEWVNKAASGRADDIARCIRCYRCFPGPLEDNGDVPLTPPDKKCSVNPQADLNELVPPLDCWPVPKSSKRVLVIGGGVGGMTAAYTAARRGHQVILAEKSSLLGGLVNHTNYDYFKYDTRNFKDLCIRRCKETGVQICLNTEITPGNIAAWHADVVIFALGSTPVVPPIPGIENAIHALRVYEDHTLAGKRIIMAGGGLVGCECALELAHLGRDVTIIEMRDDIAVDAYKMHRVALLDMLKDRVKVRTGLKCTRIEKNGLWCADAEGKDMFLQADTVVFAMGLRANAAEVDNLEAALDGSAELYRIGDCIRASKIQNAVEEGFLAAMRVV